MTEATATTTATKKAPSTRVYPIVDKDDKTRNVEASSASAAIVHVYKPQIGRPLSAGETMALVREHGVAAIEVAKS